MLHCDFCGKNQDSVEQLIAGPKSFICEECITLCADIVAEKRREKFKALPIKDPK